jgi:hypothetical protein
MKKALRTYFGILLLSLPVMLVGCRTYTEGPDFASRISAAEKIQDPGKRDKALRDVALEAAEAREGNITHQAISSMGDPNLKDRTASEAAMTLARRGDGDAATAVAETISDEVMRDSALGKIAEARDLQ